MFRSIFYLAVVHSSIGSSDSCADSDGVSVLQNRLQERSEQRVSKQLAQSNVEKAIATKGDGAPVEKSTSGKSSKSIAQLESSVMEFNEQLATAQAAYTKASSALKQHMRETQTFISDAALDAFTASEAELLTIEAQLAQQYDDLVIKLGDKLQGAHEKLGAERDDIQDKMEIYYTKSEDLHKEINARLKQLADDFYDIQDFLSKAFDDTLQPALEAAGADMVQKVADAKMTLQDVSTPAKVKAAEAAVGAASVAEHAFLVVLTPAVVGAEQLKRVGQIVENILVKTNEQLWRLKSSVQRHYIQGQEALSSATSVTQQTTADFLVARADDIEKWGDTSQIEFDRQFQLAEQFLSSLEGKLDLGVKQLNDIFGRVVNYGGELTASATVSDEINTEYLLFTFQTEQIRAHLIKTATNLEGLRVTQTAAAQSIAQEKYDKLNLQLQRAAESACVAVEQTKTTIEGQIKVVKVELDSAKEKAQTALGQAQQVADDFEAAASNAAKRLFDVVVGAVNDAASHVNTLVKW